MKRIGIAFFTFAFLCLGLFYAWARLEAESDESVAGNQVIVTGTQKHRVTPAMLESSKQMATQSAPVFQTEATDGKRYHLDTLTKEGPILLIFIKEGCPCSESAQPFFNRFYDAYGTHLKFLGVYDGQVPQAKTWAKNNQVSFPILADPDFKIIQAYKAESSAYVALVAQGGTIEKLWPGYSSEMLGDLSLRLARHAGIEPKPIDIKDSPEEMLTGCPFEL